MTPSLVAPILVFGWGNLSRGDDALGPLCLGQLREHCKAWPEVQFLEDYQLQVEHALDLAGRQHLLFIDASLTCPAPFETTPVLAARDSSFSTHAMSPQALLQVFLDVQGLAPPQSTLLAIRGERFELGEPPSPQAMQHLSLALQWAQIWVENKVLALKWSHNEI